MLKINKLTLYFIIVVFTYSCGGLSDAERVLRNEKKNTTDEFLVKKRQPLTLPPDYDTIPKPKSSNSINTNSKDGDKIDEILTIKKEKKSSNKNFKSIEESIINKISK